MQTSKAELLDDAALDGALASLNDLMALTRHHGLHETTQFIAMARLHLLIERNEVSDADFRALCDALEGKTKPRRNRSARPANSRNRRDSEMHLMQRAWQCSEFERRLGRSRVR